MDLTTNLLKAVSDRLGDIDAMSSRRVLVACHEAMRQAPHRDPVAKKCAAALAEYEGLDFDKLPAEPDWQNLAGAGVRQTQAYWLTRAETALISIFGERAR